MNAFIHILPIIIVSMTLLTWFILNLFFQTEIVDSLFQSLVFGAIFGTLLHQYIVYNTDRTDKIFLDLMGWHVDHKKSIEGVVNINYPDTTDDNIVDSRGITFILNVSTKIENTIEINADTTRVLNNISHVLRTQHNDHESHLKSLLLNYIRNEYSNKIHKYHDTHLSSYFRSLYNCIKLIEQKNITSNRSYTDIIQSSLSQSEMHLLMYHGLTEYGEKFHKMIEDYLLIGDIRINLPPTNKSIQTDPLPKNQSVAFKWLLLKVYYPNNYSKFCGKSWNRPDNLDKYLEHFAHKESINELLQ